MNLATAEVKLVRFEVAANVRRVTDRAGWFAAAVVPLLLGYLLAIGALVAWLHPLWGWPAALAGTAASQALLGGLIVWLGSRSGAGARRRASLSSTGLSSTGENRHA